MSDIDAAAGAEDDDDIIKEAKKRFALCEEWESETRDLFIDDMKFGHADSDNMWQWPGAMLTQRQLNQSSTLTINKTRQHCLQIVNDQRQNKSRIAVHPTSNEATYEAAQIFEEVVKHIEYESRAEQAYDKASENQVFGGIGYCRVMTEYRAEDSFDQEIRIRPIPDPLTVYMDPDAKEADKSDAQFAFVFDDMARDRFKIMYPDVQAGSAPLGAFDGWMGEDHVRVAEYWRRKHDRETLVSFVNDAGERVAVLKSKLPADVVRGLKRADDGSYREREVETTTIECFKIAGDTIIERSEWLGRWIPIVPAIGEETVIDGHLDRKGHVRYLKDAQRMYNYYASGATDTVALQTKTPFVGPAKAFESFEQYWAQANTQNLPYLPYNHLDDNGDAVPAPTREAPPTMPEGMIAGMQASETQLMMASGQYQAQMGENENAKSGRAISERQRQGDNATYHFIDNHAAMVRQIGRIVVDLIPKIYDTKRVMRIRGDDGTIKNIVVDPNATDAVQKETIDEKTVQIIFNPTIGRYGVQADVGPDFATKRQEAWNAIVQILTQQPELVKLIGDILFQNADFPGADEIMARLRRLVPPEALEDGPSPQLQAMQAKLAQVQGILEKTMQTLGEQKLAEKDRAQKNSIDAFDAQTRRLTAIGNSGPAVTPEEIYPAFVEWFRQVTAAGAPGQGADDNLAPRQAPDGNWYVADQARPGKYLMVQ